MIALVAPHGTGKVVMPICGKCKEGNLILELIENGNLKLRCEDCDQTRFLNVEAYLPKDFVLKPKPTPRKKTATPKASKLKGKPPTPLFLELLKETRDAVKAKVGSLKKYNAMDFVARSNSLTPIFAEMRRQRGIGRRSGEQTGTMGRGVFDRHTSKIRLMLVYHCTYEGAAAGYHAVYWAWRDALKMKDGGTLAQRVAKALAARQKKYAS